MSKFLKNVVNAVIIIVISGGIAAGVTVYVLKINENKRVYSGDYQAAFKQPVHLTGINGVAAENTDFTYAAEKTVNAVVHIKVVTNVREESRREVNPFEYFFGYGDRQQRPRQRQGSGSGIIISTDGYIITNNHVVEGADSISVTLNDKRNFTGKVIGKDATTDVALIKIDADELQPISFGDSDKLKVGEWVLAVGNPFDLTSTVTAGIVSAKGRSNNFLLGNNERDKIMSFIQTDAAVNMGNSGGALVNTRGELVGINTAIISQSGEFAGYSFAVPINMAARVVVDLKQHGSFQRAMLGVSMLSLENAKTVNDKIKLSEGAYVADFSAHSPAKEAGIEIGDVIIAVDGEKITTMDYVREKILQYHVGDKVKVKIDRYGKEKEYTVELRNAQGNTEIIKTSAKNSAEILGAAFRALSDQEKREYGKSYGIVVGSISREGKIREGGIRNGFVIEAVNEQRIQTPEEFYEIVDKILNGKTEEKGLFIRGFYPETGATRHYGINLVD